MFGDIECCLLKGERKHLLGATFFNIKFFSERWENEKCDNCDNTNWNKKKFAVFFLENKFINLAKNTPPTVSKTKAIKPSKRRLGYGSKQLELALEKCKELNLKEVLLTCDSSNIASKKIIIKNNGIFHSKINGKNEDIERYWIKLC